MLVAAHLQKNRVHVLRPRALAVLDEDFSAFYSDTDFMARERLLARVLYAFEMSRPLYEAVASPQQFAIDLQTGMHRLKAINAREFYVGARIRFPIANYDTVYIIQKILPDFMLLLEGGRIVHPLWVVRV